MVSEKRQQQISLNIHQSQRITHQYGNQGKLVAGCRRNTTPRAVEIGAIEGQGNPQVHSHPSNEIKSRWRPTFNDCYWEKAMGG
jgi:hypothetical protein